MIDKLLLEDVGLPHKLDLAVHQVNFFGWMSQGDHYEPLLLSALFYQSTPSCLKVRGGVGGVGGVGGPCDFSVSPSPFGLDFGTLDSGLTIINQDVYLDLGQLLDNKAPDSCYFLI